MAKKRPLTRCKPFEGPRYARTEDRGEKVRRGKEHETRDVSCITRARAANHHFLCTLGHHARSLFLTTGPVAPYCTMTI